MPSDEPRIVEQDGNVVRIVAEQIEVLAQMIRLEDEIIFNRLSIDGAGPGTVGLKHLMYLARQFAKSQGSAASASVVPAAPPAQTREKSPAKS